MYDDLVNALRCYAKDEECYRCEYFSEAGCDIDRMLFDAADAIEKQSAYAKLYEELTDKGQKTARKLLDIMTNKELESRFTYHAPKEGQPERYERIRYKAKMLAAYINENCPESREKSIALKKIDETVMWANASIARFG